MFLRYIPFLPILYWLYVSCFKAPQITCGRLLHASFLSADFWLNEAAVWMACYRWQSTVLCVASVQLLHENHIRTTEHYILFTWVAEYAQTCTNLWGGQLYWMDACDLFKHKRPPFGTLLVTGICGWPQSIAVATNQAISCYYFCNSCLNAINSTASCCLSLYFGTIIIICVHCDTN